MRVWFITGASRGFGALLTREVLVAGDVTGSSSRFPYRGGWCDSCANHSRPSLRPVRSPSRHLRRQCRPNERLLHYERLCRTRQPRGVAEVNRLIKTDFSEQYCVRHSGSAKMRLLFILFGWLGLGCCRCPQVLSRYSRFSRFNSRLGRQKFPVRQATGIGSQSLDIAGCFGDQAAALRGKSEKFAVSSRMDGNFPLPKEGAHDADPGPPPRLYMQADIADLLLTMLAGASEGAPQLCGVVGLYSETFSDW